MQETRLGGSMTTPLLDKFPLIKLPVLLISLKAMLGVRKVLKSRFVYLAKRIASALLVRLCGLNPTISLLESLAFIAWLIPRMLW